MSLSLNILHYRDWSPPVILHRWMPLRNKSLIKVTLHLFFKFSFFHLSSCFIAMRNMKSFLVFFFLWVFKNWMYLVINVLVEDIFTYLPHTQRVQDDLCEGFWCLHAEICALLFWLFEHFHHSVSFSLYCCIYIIYKN